MEKNTGEMKISASGDFSTFLSQPSTAHGSRNRGFTLIELVIVFTLIGILVGLGIPQYSNAMRRARESALKENLFQMRNLLEQYYTDKKQYPPSLQALVDERYLKKIPIDPFTDSAETWVEVPEELLEDDLLSGVIPGVADIQSGSEKTALDGTPYKSW